MAKRPGPKQSPVPSASYRLELEKREVGHRVGRVNDGVLLGLLLLRPRSLTTPRLVVLIVVAPASRTMPHWQHIEGETEHPCQSWRHACLMCRNSTRMRV
jgi:hypothetical protein